MVLITKTAALSLETQLFQFIPAELTDAEACAQVMSKTTQWNSGLPPDVVWSFVGAAFPHLFVETDVSQLGAQMGVNYLANAFIAHATLRTWLREPAEPAEEVTTKGKKTATRHLIFTSSF
ncbi:3-dehydrosphinganine reductase [Diaporthe eres]|uniref:3-dehydrosphinganine reductase n=1 Tax=Diaporthe eres TaxID=83184 RepID=A0ABR1P9E7_DIAER